MNQRITSLLLVTLTLSFLTAAKAADRWETLKAINLVENPTNQTHMGSRGELGPYQFRSGTWHMHTQKPFNMATERAAADEVAVSHYEWIKRGLVNAGIDANTYNIAMAWNCGLSAVVGGHIPSESYRYAERVNNIAVTFEREAQVQAQLAVVKTHDAVADATAVPPVFQVQFGMDNSEPHYVVLTNSDAPRLVVANELPRFLVAPATLRFSLAIAD